MDFSLLIVSSENSVSTKPLRAEASAAIIPGPPPLVTIARLLPLGNGWFESRIATSKSSSVVFTLIMPAWWKSTSEATSEVARAPVCDEAARAPAWVLPLLTATIGFLAETLRAIRPKLRGLPNDSR